MTVTLCRKEIKVPGVVVWEACDGNGEQPSLISLVLLLLPLALH
jgi:hypothetical protein